MNRGVAPAQWVVVPPTALTIQDGRFGKSRVIRYEPLVVRMSNQAIWLNASHSSLTQSPGCRNGPASSTTQSTPWVASSCAMVPPPAPEPMITTTGSVSSMILP
jgi:hypothetical protein